MSIPGLAGALSEYKRVGTETTAAFADPHRLIQMLLDGALEKIAIAKGFMGRGNVSEKGRHISWAISIIGGLRASLDFDKGGDVAENLNQLYEYMERRLVEANSQNNTAMLDEVAGLLREIKLAWDRVPELLKQQSRQTSPAAEAKTNSP